MAACDNLYGRKKEWQQLHDFLIRKKPEYLCYMRERPKYKGETRICYIADIQGWLILNCPYEWVKCRLGCNFIIQEMICGNPHHLRPWEIHER
jgi:hypothetical protein